MSSSRLQQPGLVEIVLGSVLSILFGISLAGLYLVFKPVPKVEMLPKGKGDDYVCYLPGRKEWSAGRRYTVKRDSFLQGQTVRLSEDEINSWLESIYPPPLPPAANKDKKEKEENAPWLFQGTPNIRLTPDGAVVAVECQLDLYGLKHTLILQMEGVFTKLPEGVAFRAEKIFIGGLPVHRLRPLKSLVFSWMAGLYEYPREVEAAWGKLSSVTIEKGQLVLDTEGS